MRVPLNEMIGQKVSHYTILEPLGRGGMGVVFKAEDTRLGRQVALKFLPEEYAENKQALERFEREARAAAKLNHPHICIIYDIDEWQGRPYIALELLKGLPLNDRIASGKIEFETLLEMGMQLTDALSAAHAAGIIHRDIKPGNIFVTESGQIKVLDFGLAKLLPREGGSASSATTVDEHLTKAGSTVGTVAYMSPEQARGKEVDNRTDLFSTGVVLYEMATGQLAFPGETSAVIFEGILTKEPVSPSRLNSTLPPELDRLISKAVEKDPDLRHQNAADLRSDLKRLRRDSMMSVSAARTAVEVPNVPMRAPSPAPQVQVQGNVVDVTVADEHIGGKRPGLAFFLGLMPGVGALYNAQFPKAAAHLVVFAVLAGLSGITNGFFGTVFGMLTFGFYAYMPFEAYHTASRRKLLRGRRDDSSPV